MTVGWEYVAQSCEYHEKEKHKENYEFFEFLDSDPTP